MKTSSPTAKLPLTTARLRIRRFEPEDLEPPHRVMSHPRVMRFSLNGPFSKTLTQQLLERYARKYEEDGFGLYAVVDRETQDLFGYRGLVRQSVHESREIEMGYRLHPDYWNQGYATEAGQAVLRHGFEDLGLKRIISIIEPANVGSIRVAEKCGMDLLKETTFKGFQVRIYGKERGNT